MSAPSPPPAPEPEPAALDGVLISPEATPPQGHHEPALDASSPGIQILTTIRTSSSHSLRVGLLVPQCTR